MSRRCSSYIIKGLVVFILTILLLKGFATFFYIPRYEDDYNIKSYFNQSWIFLNIDAVDQNIRKSEERFHSMVENYYREYRTFYKPELVKALNQTLIPNVIDNVGVIIPKCDKPPFLLIQVHSTTIHVKKRLSIRHSWGNPEKTFNQKTNKSVRILFVVGRSRIKKVDEILYTEAKQYQDVLLTNFFDSYRRLSRKTQYALTWASSYCLPSYMLKTDDDCYVNIPNILRYLTRHPSRNLYTGRIQWFMPAIRNQSSKFYTSREEYNRPIYPPYASGGGYLFSGNLIPDLVNVSRHMSMVPNEDAYFGTLMDAINITPKDHNLMLPFIYCNESIWERPSCDFLIPYVIHGVHNYAQIWIHYHVKVLSLVNGLCKQSQRNRHKLDIPIYCPNDDKM